MKNTYNISAIPEHLRKYFQPIKGSSHVLGYQPSCECWPTMDENDNFTWLPGIVFDPFVGSGTTLQVAKELGLRSIGLDISHSYLDKQAKVRSGIGSPSNALDGLPMFADKVEE